MAKKAAPDFEGGLYLAIGKPIGKGNHTLKPQYIGLSKENCARRSIDPNHHIMKNLQFDKGLWLGQISTAEPSGKRLLVTKNTLRYAEWLHVLFMEMPLNKRLRTLPKKPVTILNRWWKTDYITRRQNRPHKSWPDLIDYLGQGARSRVVWFGKRQVIQKL
jgi:hypothetical protein